MGGNVSHDKITRFLSQKELNSKQLWKLVKPVVKEQEREEGVLIVDDTIEKKPHTTESELRRWHHDHHSSAFRSEATLKVTVGLCRSDSFAGGTQRAFVATSEDEKKQGNFTRMDSLAWSSQEKLRGWLRGLEFPVLLHPQVLTNSGATPRLFKTLGNAHQDKDASTGMRVFGM